MQLLNTLSVTLADIHLRLDNDTLRLLMGEGARLRVPLHHLGAVVCFGHVSVSVPLMGDARKAVVVAFQERKQETLTHALLAENVPLGLTPLVQARLLARHVRGEAEAYVPFTMR